MSGFFDDADYLDQPHLEDLGEVPHWSCRANGLLRGKLSADWICSGCGQNVTAVLPQYLRPIFKKLIRKKEREDDWLALQPFRCRTIHAFDADWLVPGFHFDGAGDYLDRLCERLEEDGVLHEDRYRHWGTGDPEKLLIDERPIYWRYLCLTQNYPRINWNARRAMTAGAWSYFIPQDVRRFCPPLLICAQCGASESKTWDVRCISGSPICSLKCQQLIYRSEWRKERMQCRKRLQERRQIERGRQMLRQTRAWLRNRNQPACGYPGEESKPDRTSPTS